MENINDELILSAMEEPVVSAKTKPFARIKWSVLAACLALALAVPAVAYVIGYTTSYDDENNAYWAETNYKLNASDFNENLSGYTTGGYPMEDMASAEAFLGTPLPDNKVLESAGKNNIYISESETGENAEGSHCWVHITVEDGSVISADVWANYYLSEKTVSVGTYYVASTDKNINDGAGFGIQHNGFREKTGNETYVNAAGRIFDLTVFEDSDGRKSITAYTDIDGYLVCVDISGIDRDSVRETAIEILEAYN